MILDSTNDGRIPPLEIIAQFELHRGARATQLNVQFQRHAAATAQQVWRRNNSFPHSGANTNVHRQFKSIEKERTCFVLNSRIGDMLKNIENHEFTLSPSIDNGKLLKANAPTVSCFGHNLANYAAFIGDIVCIELVSGISHMTLPKLSVSPLNEREE